MTDRGSRGSIPSSTAAAVAAAAAAAAAAQQNQAPTFLMNKRTFELDKHTMEHLSQMEPNHVVNEVEHVLVKSISSRDDNDITILYFYFRMHPFIEFIERTIGEQSLLTILSYITFEKFQHKRMICKQGDPLRALIFILGGKAFEKKVIAEPYVNKHCTVSIRKRTLSVNAIERGAVIGDPKVFLSFLPSNSSPRSHQPFAYLPTSVRASGLAVKCGVLKRSYFIALLDLFDQTAARAKYTLIENCPLFRQHMNYKQLQTLNVTFNPRTYFANNFVYHEDESVEYLYLIQSGRFRVLKSIPLNYEFNVVIDASTFKQPKHKRYSEVAVLEKGMCFGEEEILQEREKRAFSIVCESAIGEVFVISKKDFMKIISDEFRSQERKGMESLTKVKVDWRADKLNSNRGVQLKYQKYFCPPPKFSQQAHSIQEKEKLKGTIQSYQREHILSTSRKESPSKIANSTLLTEFEDSQQSQQQQQQFSSTQSHFNSHYHNDSIFLTSKSNNNTTTTSILFDSATRSRSLKASRIIAPKILSPPPTAAMGTTSSSVQSPSYSATPSAPALFTLNKLTTSTKPFTANPVIASATHSNFQNFSSTQQYSLEREQNNTSNNNNNITSSIRKEKVDQQTKTNSSNFLSPREKRQQISEEPLRVQEAYSPRSISNKNNKKFILPTISFEEYENIYSKNNFASSLNGHSSFRSSYSASHSPQSTSRIGTGVSLIASTLNPNKLPNSSQDVDILDPDYNPPAQLNLTFYNEKDTTIRRVSLENRSNYPEKEEQLSYEVPVMQGKATPQLEQYQLSLQTSREGSLASSMSENVRFQFTPEDLGLEYLEKRGIIKKKLHPLKREQEMQASNEKSQKIIEHFIVNYLVKKDKRNSRTASSFTMVSPPFQQANAFQPLTRPNTYQILTKKNRKKRAEQEGQQSNEPQSYNPPQTTSRTSNDDAQSLYTGVTTTANTFTRGFRSRTTKTAQSIQSRLHSSSVSPQKTNIHFHPLISKGYLESANTNTESFNLQKLNTEQSKS